jgi:tRNA(fMet)-specific endonuclease VapC
MGIILDSSILIAAERGGEGVGQILKRVSAAHGETEAGLSAVTIVELTHGIYRAKIDSDRERRQSFTDELCRDVAVHPVTLEVAQLAERLRGSKMLVASASRSKTCSLAPRRCISAILLRRSIPVTFD